MTVAPRLWTDPRNGLAYPTGSKLPSANMNAYVGGLREIDEAIERSICLNWPYYHTESNYEAGHLCWYPDYQLWVFARQDLSIAANPGALKGYSIDYMVGTGAVGAGDGLTVKDVCGWGIFCIMCGTPGASSNKKYRFTNDGCATWAIGTAGSTDTKSINSVCHHYTSGGAVSLFVSGGKDGIVETSPTGLTWTSRTPANTNDIASIRSNGVELVGVSSVSTNKCVRSTNATDWTESTMATTATWVDVCWASNQGYWVAVGVSGGNMVFNKSTDGITWEAVTVTSGMTLTDTPVRMVSTGNALVLIAAIYFYVSFDLGATWRRRGQPTSNPLIALAAATDPDGRVCQLAAVGNFASTDTDFWASHLGS